MGNIPVDAQRVVDKLRATRREAAAAAPKHWVPPDSFGQAMMNVQRTPVHVNSDLNWMHHNWELRENRNRQSRWRKGREMIGKHACAPRGLGHEVVIPPRIGAPRGRQCEHGVGARVQDHLGEMSGLERGGSPAAC